MFAKLLQDAVRDFCPLTPAQICRMEAHYQLILRWNKKMNLTRITKLEEVVIRHYGESLFLAVHLPLRVRVVDIGSGAGFPGLPAAILHADSSFHLVESHQRKAVFLREATRDLTNVEILPVRVETLDKRYDWLISRAVDPKTLLGLKCADHMALLIGEEDSRQCRSYEKVPLPWGERRVLLLR